MNTILTVFNPVASKDFVLPNINNSNYSILLEKGIFGLSKDVTLILDVIEGKWRVLDGKHYVIRVDSRIVETADIDTEKTIEVYTEDGVLVKISADISQKSVMQSTKYIIKRTKITIGSTPDNDIVYKDPLCFISSHHAEIVRKKDGWYIDDCSRNGVFLNSKRVKISSILRNGDLIKIFGLKIVFIENILILNVGNIEEITVNKAALEQKILDQKKIDTDESCDTKKVYFNRAPRITRELHAEDIEIEGPPAPKQGSSRSLLMTIGPSFTMAIPMLMGCLLMIFSSRSTGSATSPMMFTGLITAVTSAMLGAFWAILNYRNSSTTSIKEEKHRFEAYSDYLMRSAEKIKTFNEENIEIMGEIYPSAISCLNYNENNPKLWNRNYTHSDFLIHRLGIGNVPFQSNIIIPKEKFTLLDDSLADKPKLIKETYQTLKDAPICIDIKNNSLIGVVGGKNKTGSYEVMKLLSAQIATNNCYTDVKLCYIFKEGCNRNALSFAKWLPHTWSEDKRTRFCAFNREEASDVCYELTKVLRLRDEMMHESNNKVTKPHYVLFVEDVSLLEGEPLAKYIFDTETDYGFTTVLFAENYENLPNSCECIIYNEKKLTGVYTPKTLSSLGDNLSYDAISDSQLETLARNLSKIEVAEVETGGEIPNSLTFLEMYGVEIVEDLNVIERWKKNKTYDNMRALVGQRAGGTDCFLDIHEKYHGPHGLVAGTTGSGKSETLQTYILSLALNYSPDDIGFLLVDFKGGGMANLFTDLPHTLGQISNLSGAQVRRAMVSIKSENLRRQRVLGEHGVNNINAYTRLLKNNEATVPMPHLFIIIDEFAELKREEPEFMSELISVAQVGRSLGVHLILATQKPGGTVDDNIRSNSKFKLCLRVQDKQDSSEMLGRPDAAYLSQAGRCYMQVGNDEIFELFQSGWSGASYDVVSGGVKNLVKLISDTGKVSMSGNKTSLKNKENSKKKWLASFLNCLSESAADNSISFEEALLKPEMMNLLMNSLFNILEQMEISYPRSRYNEIAAKNLVEILVECENKNIIDVIDYALKQNTALPEQKELTQLDAVINHIKDIAQKYNYEKQPSLWLPMLPEVFYLDEIDEYSRQKNKEGTWLERPTWSLIAPVGMYDDPENQAQRPLCIDFAGGHLAVCGSVTSGKSTFLQTMIYSLINLYSPLQVNIYAIDFSSHLLQAFEPAPHIGGVMIENDLEKIDKFFNMIEKMLQQRKVMIGGGNYSQYVKVNGYAFPSVVIAIDNYASFREKTDDKYEKILWELSRDGAGMGIFLAISAGGYGALDIQNKIAENLRNVVALDMGEKMKYCDVLRTNRFDVMITSGIKGRGLVPCEGTILEFHTALSVAADDDYSRIEKIQAECLHMREQYSGKTALKVPEIPEKPTWKLIAENDDFIESLKAVDKLPIAYNRKSADIYSINLAEVFCYLIQGRARTGRTNLLKIMAAAAKQKNADVCIMDSDNGPLQDFCQKIDARYVRTTEEIFTFCKELTPVFQSRNKIKKELLASGAEDEEIFARMSEEKPIFIFVSDISDFISKIYDYHEVHGTMNKFFENILEKGSLHNIYFIFDSNMETSSELLGRKVYNLITGYRTGMQLGGNLDSPLQKAFTITDLPFAERTRTYKPGEGRSFVGDGSIHVVIPTAKGV